MPVTTDIAATYRGPGRVMRRLLADGASEPRALAFVMGACMVMFVAQWPALSRDAHLQGTDLQPAIGGALMGTIFILPLVLYALAALSQLVLRALSRPVGGYAARLALFWALLAASPLALLNGLVAGFVGPGGALQLVGALWLGVFLWFWIASLRVAGQEITP